METCKLNCELQMEKTNGPWRVKSSQVKYSNPWLTVIEDKVIRPDGNPGIYGVVVIKDGVSVLALDNDKVAYLTKEFHYAVERETIETVSGGMDGSESPLEAAKRELKEELGITAAKWTSLGMSHPLTAVIEKTSHMFLARGLTFGKANQEGTEQIQLVKISFDRAVEMVMNSEITHAASCIAILKAKMLLSK
ncbi:MAG: NUDIX hydrolase [Candidatus Micrarchaeota archaeon]